MLFFSRIRPPFCVHWAARIDSKLPECMYDKLVISGLCENGDIQQSLQCAISALQAVREVAAKLQGFSVRQAPAARTSPPAPTAGGVPQAPLAQTSPSPPSIQPPQAQPLIATQQVPQPPEPNWDDILGNADSHQAAAQLVRFLVSPRAFVVAAQHIAHPSQLAVVAKLEEPYRSKLRDEVLQTVLKNLTTSGDTPLPPSAAMMAELVTLELVSLRGAATTLNALLNDSTTRRAAMAVLGKLSERKARGTAAFLPAIAHLQSLVCSNTDPQLEYDVAYISKTLGWREPKLTLNHAVAVATPHTKPIVSSAYFSQRDEFITGSMDGSVCVWGAPSLGDSPSTVFRLSPFYPCCMDAAVKGNVLAVACAGSSLVAPQIHLYPYHPESAWGKPSILERPSASAVTYIKCIWSRQATFVAAETTLTKSHNIVLFSSHNTQVREFVNAHSDYITCLATSADNENMLISGGRDNIVKVWDSRLPKPQSTSLTAHTDTITTISSVRDVIATGSLDRRLIMWDVRKLQSPVEEKSFASPVLKLACTTQVVLVSTVNALMALQLHPLQVEDIIPNVCYHEVRFNSDSTVAFAAGADKCVDVFALKPR